MDLPESKLTDAALSWIGERGDRMFFLWIHYMNPHGPYRPPSRFRGTFTHAEPKLVCRYYLPPYLRAGSLDLLDYVDRYDEEILEIDFEVDRLLDFLESRDLTEKTLVIFSSDHGESFDHNYFAAHGRYSYDNLIRVPLIFSMPGIIPGSNRR